MIIQVNDKVIEKIITLHLSVEDECYVDYMEQLGEAVVRIRMYFDPNECTLKILKW